MNSTPRRLRLLHLDLKTVYSYGDQLLFELVRQTFNGFGGGRYFDLTATHPFREAATSAFVDNVNENFDAVVIGGGGLFPRRVNAAATSGWQWNISIELLRKLTKPIVVFGAGNPPPFEPETFKPVFRRHINQTMSQSVFFGLRSTGAVDSMREYLDSPTGAPLALQPCPTTLGRILMPSLAAPRRSNERRLGLQLGLEDVHIDDGLNPDEIFPRYVTLVRELQADGWQIDFLAHKRTDFLFFRKYGTELGLRPVPLYGHPSILFTGVAEYATLPLVLGARGHSQMIPFGLGNVPLSLSTNDKIRYFAQEAGHPEWLIDPWGADLVPHAMAAISRVEEERDQLGVDLANTQQRFLDTTLANLSTIYERLTGERIEAQIEPYSQRELSLAEAGYADSYQRRLLAEQVSVLDQELANNTLTADHTRAISTDAAHAPNTHAVSSNTAATSAALVLNRATQAARAGDYTTARALRAAAAALDSDMVAATGTPRWDSGPGRYIPAPALRMARRLKRTAAESDRG